MVSAQLVGVFAHPDDESRITGGTLALAAARGVSVALYCATRGGAGDAARPPGETAELREGELRAACAALGVGELWLDDFPDGGLSNVHAKLLVERIVRFLRAVRPQAVITFGPDGRTGHADHVVIGQRVGEAFAAAGDLNRWPEHAEEGLAPWQPGWLYHTAVAESVASQVGWRQAALPDGELLAVDVSEVLERKQHAAVEAHASQWALSPFDTSRGWGPWSVEHYRLAAAAERAAGPDPLRQLSA